MPDASRHLLRVAAAWGTTIVGVKLLSRGQDCVFGEAAGALSALPDALDAPTAPLRAVGAGWELDARGAVNGILLLRGREESVAGIARSGAPVQVLPGDYGLLQYGLFSLFFQFTAPSPPMVEKRAPLLAPLALLGQLIARDPLGGLSLFSSLVFHLGLIGLLVVNWTPEDYRLPPELVSPEDYAARFGLSRPMPEMEPVATPDSARDVTRSARETGPKDARKAASGEKIKVSERKTGAGGNEDRSDVLGQAKPVKNYGGLSEALADTGGDIKKALNEIQTVAEALGGLNSANVALGNGPAAGLRGGASSGGGTGAGVMFGAGTLNTGWAGGGVGAGFGTSTGRGNSFGAGGGGAGAAKTVAPGEHTIAAGDVAPSHGGLGAEQIRRVVVAHRAALQACFEIEAQKDPTLKGGVTVSWTIDAAGAVAMANVGATTIHNARVEGCVLRQVRSWHFPSSDGSSQATFPFSFGIGH